MTIKGILAIGFGIMMLVRNNPMIKSSLAISFGVLVVVSGLLIITGAFLHRKISPRWRSWLIEGIIDIFEAKNWASKVYSEMASAFKTDNEKEIFETSKKIKLEGKFC